MLSPFAVYIDSLLKWLSKSGVRCYIGNRFMGAVLFADDIKLLTPTFKGLKKLVSICEKYAKEYDIKFNNTKNKYMVYKSRNAVVHHENSCCYSVVTNKPFKQYCCFFHGAPLCSVEPLCVAWRKALKIIWNVPWQTHCRLIALLLDSASLKARFVKFMCKALEHDNQSCCKICGQSLLP